MVFKGITRGLSFKVFSHKSFTGMFRQIFHLDGLLASFSYKLFITLHLVSYIGSGH